MLAPIEEIFFQVDDFCNQFFAKFEKKMFNIHRRKQRASNLFESEIITLMILFNMSSSS